jgi:tetratricopeptide (TPR) repeat protein
MGGRVDEAERLLDEAIAILGGASLRAETARAQVQVGEVLFATDRIEEAVALLQQALAAYEADDDEAAVATVSAQLARLLFFKGRPEEAMPHVERALELGERLRLAEVVVQALNNKALLLRHRPNESLGLMRQALVLAEESADDRGALRACMNLGYLLSLSGRNAEAQEVTARGIALARRRGDRVWERSLASNLVAEFVRSGRWDDAERLAAELPVEGAIASDPVHVGLTLDLATVALARGEYEQAAAMAREIAAWRETARVQARGAGHWARMLLALAEGRPGDAVAECLTALRDTEIASLPEAVEIVTEVGGEAGLALRSADAIAEILELARAAPIDVPPSLEARFLLQEARVAALRGDAEPPFEAAVTALRRTGEPYLVAAAQLEQAEWLADHDRADEAPPLLAEARTVFERLRAAPRLERVERLVAVYATSSTSAPTST